MRIFPLLWALPLLLDSHRTGSLPYDIGMCSVIQSYCPPLGMVARATFDNLDLETPSNPCFTLTPSCRDFYSILRGTGEELQLRNLHRCGNISNDSRFSSPFKQKEKEVDLQFS